MRIYLVRHGESESNVDRTVGMRVADHAIQLTEKGKLQAVGAGRFLNEYLKKHIPPKKVRVWRSPYTRARDTAENIVRETYVWVKDVKEHALLCEQQFGLFDGIPEDELSTRFPLEHAHYKKCEDYGGRFYARMPLGESRFDVAVRVHQSFGTFHRDADKHGVQDIIVVCHGVTLRAFVMMWCHKTPEWFDEEPNPRNGAIRLLDNGYDLGYIYEGT